MQVRPILGRTALAVCLLICALSALPARALASATEQSLLMDDRQLIYSSPGHVIATMKRLKALGIDRIKASIVWTLVAPNPTSHRVPRFNAADPNAYPPGAWARWDLLVREAQQLGLGVYFQITPPAPSWAVAKGKPTEGYAWSQKPSTVQYGKFVEAILRRYSGSYVPPGSSTPLPRVSYWGIWNEPNEGAWLNPQWRTSGGRRIYTAPAMYRALIDAAWHAFVVTHHTHDTFLIGEIASRGWIYPIPFVNALYCVGGNERPLTGQAAANVSCPRSGSRSAFVKAHPGLFSISGFAHHPYSFDVPPNRVMSDPNLITLANLGRLERALDRILSSYGRSRRGGLPMYLTEFAYKTNPPNPFVHTSLTEQAVWTNEAEYMTWRDPHVQALAQFLLFDDRPRAHTRPGTRQYWSTFQSGLLFSNGRPKPSYDAYRVPIWLISSRHAHLTVWGQFRPADHTAIQTGTLEYLRSGTSTWTVARAIQTASPEGFLVAHLSLPAPGRVRLSWQDPATGAIYYSRVASVS